MPGRRCVHQVEARVGTELLQGGYYRPHRQSTRRLLQQLKNPNLFSAVEGIEKSVLSAEEDPSEVHPWSIEEMAAADGFTDVEQRDLLPVRTTTAADFVGRLSTVSAYLMLGPKERAEALRQVRAVLPDQVEIDNTLQLSLARRV